MDCVSDFIRVVCTFKFRFDHDGDSLIHTVQFDDWVVHTDGWVKVAHEHAFHHMEKRRGEYLKCERERIGGPK